MVQKEKKVSFLNVRDEPPNEVKWLPREGSKRVSWEGACANFQARTGKGKCQKGQTAHGGFRQLRILHRLFYLRFRGGPKFFQNLSSQKDTFPRQGKAAERRAGGYGPSQSRY